jgi:hypothetical protein
MSFLKKVTAKYVVRQKVLGSNIIETSALFWKDGKKIIMEVDESEYDVTNLFPQPQEADFIPEEEGDSVELEIKITYTFSPYRRGDGPGSYYGPTPDEPAGIEDMEVDLILPNKKTINFNQALFLKPIGGYGRTPNDKWEEEALKHASSDDGYDGDPED